MANPSNLYAEKIFSEHPLALWALDDQVEYISLINDTQRHLESWTVTGGTATNETSISDEPLPSIVTKIVGSAPSTPMGQVKMVSPNIVPFENLESSIETFSLGAYIYTDGEYGSSYEIGYQYTDSITSQVVEEVKKYETSIDKKWLFISETFRNSKVGSGTENIKIVLKINYSNVGTPAGGYKFYVNGISFGQLSEEFSALSLGQDAQTLPEELLSMNTLSSPDVLKRLPAKAYGLASNQGYYLSNGRTLFAKNSGVPLVYGAYNTTVISANTNGLPSIIIPSQGFLNESGKYNDYTAEFWIRLESFSTQPRRIFGPVLPAQYVSSTQEDLSAMFLDGIYAEGPFVKIKVGTNTGSHFLGEWSRPMLFDFRIGDGIASLMINGEQVISIPIDLKQISFPDELYTLPTMSKPQEQNWLGFYAYDDIPRIEIDCVAIYGYQVSSILAKRRFAYGQAVDFPESSNTAYGGTSVFIDYPFSSYTNNYSYPDVGTFSSGIIDNLVVSENSISSPKYSLPEVFFSDPEFSINDWNNQNQALSATVGEACVSFGPTSGYMFFDKLNIVKDNIKAIYGIFESATYPEEKQTLIKIQNKITGDYFSSYILGAKIGYEIKFSGVLTELYTEGDFVINEPIFSGIDIDTLSSFYGGNVASIFGNKNQLMVIIGGNQDFTNTFTGRMYKVGFCTNKNFKAIKKYFNPILPDVLSYDSGSGYYGSDPLFWSGIIDGGTTGASFQASELFTHTASYTLIPQSSYGNFGLDVVTDSYWEDYVPLSFLSQYVTNSVGEKVYDLDFIQFNVGYPALQIYSGESYNTSTSSIKTYVTFKYDQELPINFEDRYIYTVAAPKNNVIEPGTNKYVVSVDSSNDPIYDNFYNTRYEVVDGMIIYPPAGVDASQLLMSMHIKITTNGTENGQVKIKSLQLASQAFNSSVPNPIGTRFGNNIYPYKKYGMYYNYKARNPFRIYKGSTPYLYLTRSSGIEMVGDKKLSISNGLEIPINENLAEEYNVIAMQMAVRFNNESFPTTPTEIFEIESKSSHIKFFVVANDFSGTRGRIYAANATTGKIENGIAFYLNGKIVRDPVLSKNSWAFLGINFQNNQDFSLYTGALRITGPVLTNVISFYKSTNLQEIQKAVYRPWSRVLQSLTEGTLKWEYWEGDYTWNQVLVIASLDYYGVDPSTIYKTYTGTNKIIVDDSRQIKINTYEYGVYKYSPTATKIINAV
jgi:hypothetical protein